MSSGNNHYSRGFASYSRIDMKNKNIKVLLVEDDPFLIELYSAKLKKEGLSLAVADEEKEGFEKALEEKPDVILIDISLPEKEDFWLLKHIKSHDRLQNIPVLILSDLESEAEVAEALSLGAEDYLIRSQIAFQDVVKKLKNLVLGGKRK
ncbi:response regulator [Candidatus Falkowbacteria bacterium]|nr:response regulator [Candidatus Falkowbacteria bacterium]